MLASLFSTPAGVCFPFLEMLDLLNLHVQKIQLRVSQRAVHGLQACEPCLDDRSVMFFILQLAALPFLHDSLAYEIAFRHTGW